VRSPSATARRRRAGYELFGPAFDYVLHTRPAEWPVVAAHVAVGTLLAWSRGPAASQGVEALIPALLGMGLWVVCLNGGTLAVNSAFDRDEGDIAYLRDPPPAPRHLFAFGAMLMIFGLGASAALPTAYWRAYALSTVMSLVYSVPPLRLKAVAGLDWFINMWGFGTLTAFAGWAATAVPVDRVGLIVLLAFCPLFAALYPLTQLYQLDEDRRRGDLTLAAVIGARNSLALAIAAAGIAFLLLVYAATRPGERPGAVIPIVLAALAWLALLLPWYRRVDSLAPPAHQRRMYAALAAWAVTDVAVLWAFR
jgi:4-hydroxybenzoate polyprenyltransferase